MAREFNVVGTNITVAGATTLIFINPAASVNFNLEFRRWWIGFTGSNTSIQQRVQIVSQASAFPTLTSATPVSLKLADPNASIITGATNGAAGKAGINASAEGGGSKTVLRPDAFNQLNGYLLVLNPGETMVFPAGYSQGMGLYLPTAPSTLSGWEFGATYAEV